MTPEQEAELRHSLTGWTTEEKRALLASLDTARAEVERLTREREEVMSDKCTTCAGTGWVAEGPTGGGAIDRCWRCGGRGKTQAESDLAAARERNGTIFRECVNLTHERDVLRKSHELVDRKVDVLEARITALTEAAQKVVDDYNCDGDCDACAVADPTQCKINLLRAALLREGE